MEPLSGNVKCGFCMTAGVHGSAPASICCRFTNSPHDMRWQDPRTAVNDPVSAAVWEMTLGASELFLILQASAMGLAEDTVRTRFGRDRCAPVSGFIAESTTPG